MLNGRGIWASMDQSTLQDTRHHRPPLIPHSLNRIAVQGSSRLLEIQMEPCSRDHLQLQPKEYLRVIRVIDSSRVIDPVDRAKLH
ncbi:hypothetical protein Nepgr_033795 [Nepenthes gracilis]|uniref:Uncharacterized protein n=1 Tax=Nepenthes gracilis TaxID=150966 RepID=A0AAD3Y951_NEPGR|nr:hypothetical protein Nepgr_033795 [Nepenthes gracilis]